MTRKIYIMRHQLGLVFRRGDYVRLLPPGEHRLPFRWRYPEQVEVIDTRETRFEHPLLDLLVREPTVRERLEVVELGETGRALIWRDDRLAWVLGPGRYAFWKEPYTLAVELYDTGTIRFEHPREEAVVASPAAREHLATIQASNPQEQVLIYRDGELVQVLTGGRYTWWTQAARVESMAVDMREQVLDIKAQEVMTSDKVTIRANLVVVFRVTDPRQAVAESTNYGDALYREAQLAFRALVGGRSLEALLAEKERVGDELLTRLEGYAGSMGLAVKSAGLRDLVLPGEMKSLFNQVIQARKEAEANLIRRREETAAARSQANTARLMAEQPHLARMRELEALQAILAGMETTMVLAPGDLAGQFLNLIRSDGKGE